MVAKDGSPTVTASLVQYAKHIHSNYENVSLIFEPHVAKELQQSFDFPIHTTSSVMEYAEKVDITTTLGGDGTILHASSLFATATEVPPVLSFSMGTLGFLGEWKFAEFKRAFRETYVSGSAVRSGSLLFQGQDPKESESGILAGWSSISGKSMGPIRVARVLLRNRLRVGVFDADGSRISGDDTRESANGDVHAMNEVIIHRGKEAHLAVIEVFVGGRFLTEAVADGMIISSPTGSTAYSLSSGGAIVHPLVSSLLVTPICPRSLSFRPLVLPAKAPITLRLSAKNRGREMEVSIDGRRRNHGVGAGMEVRVVAEAIRREQGTHSGGVPCIMRRENVGLESDDGWVGGLNGLLKFNYPFGEE